MSDLTMTLRASLYQALVVRMIHALKAHGTHTPDCKGNDSGCTCGWSTEVAELIKQARNTALPEA